MNHHIWKSNALAENGKHYKILMYLLPVLPIGLLLFNWYTLCNEEYNDFVLGFVFLVNLVFMHQEVDLIRFFLIAKKTIKQVELLDNVITLSLFNDEKLHPSDFLLNKSIPKKLSKNNGIYYRLFPANKASASIIIDNKEYYLTATLDNFDEMYKYLEHLCMGHSDKTKNG